jgi:hypothetical protein
MMTGDAHKMAVLKILDRIPGAKTKGFGAALIKALLVDDPEWEMPAEIRIIPDAFAINDKDRTAIVFEVEVSNQISDSKVADYCEIWWALDDCEWRFGLITIDRWGAVTSVVDFKTVALERCVLEASRSTVPPRPKDIDETQELARRFRDLNPWMFEAGTARRHRVSRRVEAGQGDLFN